MKLFYFILALITFHSTFSQKTILQPALRDSNKKLDSIYTYIQYPDQDEYHYSVLRNLTFDTDKNPTSNSYEGFDENNILILKSRLTTANYNPLNNYSSELFPSTFPRNSYTSERLNLNTNTWMPERNSIYFNNEKIAVYNVGNKSQKESYYYDDNHNVTYASKHETQFTNNYPTEYLKYSWNSTTNAFEQSYKYILYNTFTNGELTTRITNKITDFNTNSEEQTYKEEFVDMNPSPSYEKTTFLWNGTTWDNKEYKQVIYTNNLISTLFSYNWDYSTSNWVENLRSEYIYDNNDNLVDFKWYHHQILRYHEVLSYDSDNLVTERILNKYNTTTGNLSYTKRSVYYYSPDNNLKVDDTNFTALKVYPNPIKSAVYLSFNKPVNYEITSTQGVKVMQGKAQNSIHTESLQNGVYFLTLKYENRVTTKKIIVSK